MFLVWAQNREWFLLNCIRVLFYRFVRSHAFVCSLVSFKEGTLQSLLFVQRFVELHSVSFSKHVFVSLSMWLDSIRWFEEGTLRMLFCLILFVLVRNCCSTTNHAWLCLLFVMASSRAPYQRCFLQLWLPKLWYLSYAMFILREAPCKRQSRKGPACSWPRKSARHRNAPKEKCP